MRNPLQRDEWLLLGTTCVLLLAALLAPALPHPPHAHDFADARTLWGIPCALDVLSNLPFALAGLVGGWLVWRLPAGTIGSVQRALAGLFFAGLVLTAIGSSYYHLAPDDAGLAVDRYAMAIAFAGLLGLAAATRISERAGAVLGLGLLVAAPAAVAAWSHSGNVLPWALVQFGGMVAVLALACLRPRSGALTVGWWWVLAAYGVAKLCESNDHAIFSATGQWLSGHTLKHVAAACAAVPVLAALAAATRGRQNASGPGLVSSSTLARRAHNA